MNVALDVTALQRACGIAGRVLRGVGDTQLGDPTSCSQWTVQEVVGHLVGLTDFFADIGEQGASPDGRNWPEYAVPEMAPAFTRHAERLVRAFADGTAMVRPMRLPSGDSTGRDAIQFAITDLYVHSRDLATATHQTFAEDGIADSLVGSDNMAMCARARDDPSRPLSHEVPITGDAPPLERLMASLERDPSCGTR